MPAKAKPKMHSRLEHAWIHHPIVSLSTIIGVVTLISMLAPGVFWAISHFQTVDDAKKVENELRRNIAWGLVQSIKTESIALRNRVNDCDIRKDKQDQMTRLERDACAQYQQEFDDATRRFNEARKAALEISSKEK